MNDFWQHCSALLERELTPQQYVTWIKPLAPVDFDAEANTLRIAAPNRFKLDWVKSQFSGRIADMARDFWHAPVDVQFVLDPKADRARGARRPRRRNVRDAHVLPASRRARACSGGRRRCSAAPTRARTSTHWPRSRAARARRHSNDDDADLDLPSLDANEAAAARRTWRPGQSAVAQATAKTTRCTSARSSTPCSPSTTS